MNERDTFTLLVSMSIISAHIADIAHSTMDHMHSVKILTVNVLCLFRKGRKDCKGV